MTFSNFNRIIMVPDTHRQRWELVETKTGDFRT